MKIISLAMASAVRSSFGEGMITMHWTVEDTQNLISEELPVPEYPQHYTKKTSRETFKTMPKKPSSPRPLFRSLTPSFLRIKPCEEWLNTKPLTALEEIEDDERRAFNRATQTVLDTENYFVKELDKYLKHTELVNLRKKEINYKKWSQKVSEPLLQAIEDHIDSYSSKDIERRRRHQLAQYLNHCNAKGHVFLDVYDPSEYDPFYLSKSCSQYFKVSTPHLNDPLLKPVQDKLSEDRIILHCIKGRIYSNKEIDDLHKQKLPFILSGREDTNGIEWLKAPLCYIESEVRQRSRRKIRRNVNAGILDFKAWAESRCTPELFSKEMHLRHKRKFLNYSLHYTPAVKQVQANLTEV
ncbi:protein FAM228B isoform X2 [Rhinatrema bivittatum]|uniref:protein FAM228B isoform X2 n=1 Tax=Rhinatrema bivittatum TaxID=194408 RepID=UPI00112B6BF9|nr:protein FAM228B isoform X2 [Rhinatrema bivittatum]